MRKIYLALFSVCLLATAGFSQVFEEDFENGLPMDWTLEGAFELTDANGIASQYFTPPDHTMFVGVNDDALGNGGNGFARMETAMIDLTNAPSGLVLEMDAYFINGDFQGADETGKVYVSTDAGVTWEELYSTAGFGTAWGRDGFQLPYSGMQIWLAFEYQDGGGWNYGWCIDDIAIDVAPGREVAVLWLNEEQYFGGGFTGGTVVPGVVVQNNGTEVLESIELVVNDGNSDNVMTISGLNVGFGEKVALEGAPVTIGEEDMNLNVRIENVNGQGDDENTSNDIGGNVSVSIITPHPDRGVIAEEGTGTWCQFCPRGQVFVEGLSRRYPNQFIGIAVHNGDPMTNAAYDSGMNLSGYPSGKVERGDIIDPSEFENPFVSAVQNAPLARVDVGAAFDNGQLTVSVGAEVLAAMGPDHTLAAILYEDYVTGTSSGYNQVNFYSGAQFSMGGFELMPSIVPGADMIYSHVGRELVGGFNGLAGTISEGAQIGEQHVEVFPTMTLNTNYNYDNLHLVAVLIHAPENGAKTIKNAWSKTLDDAVRDGLITVSTIDLSSIEDVKVFPNPFQEETQVTLNLKESANVRLGVYDATGKAVFSQNYGELQGQNNLSVNTVDFEEGNYFFQVVVENQTITKMATKVK